MDASAVPEAVKPRRGRPKKTITLQEQEQENLAHHKAGHEAGIKVKLSCPKCGAFLGSRTALLRHIKYQHPDDPSVIHHPCKLCERVYSNRGNLCHHMKVKHTERETVKPNRFTLHDRTCAECHQIFALPSDLEHHKKNCLKGEIPTCKVCQRSFATAFGLHIHSRVHVRSRPYKCSICLKVYTQQGGLRQHIQEKHTGSVRRYPCSYCKDLFCSSNYVAKHIRLKHPEVKQEPKKTGLWECHLCSRTFKKQENLAHHKAIHEAGTEVKLPCPKCGALVGSLKTLRKHLKHQHPDDPSLRCHPCSVCGIIFSYRGNLLHHMKVKHGATATNSQQKNDAIITSNNK